MSDNTPEFNQLDISDDNGPIDTRANPSDGKVEERVHDKDINDKLEVLKQSPGVPCFDKKLRHEYNSSSFILTDSYQIIFQKAFPSSGKLIGFIYHFNNSNNQIKLTIDSQIIFDLPADDLVSIQSDGPGSSGLGIRSTGGGPLYDNADNKYIYHPAYPICYFNSLKIEAKKADSGQQPSSLIDCIVNFQEGL